MKEMRVLWNWMELGFDNAVSLRAACGLPAEWLGALCNELALLAAREAS
jgi:hypothetical protein